MRKIEKERKKWGKEGRRKGVMKREGGKRGKVIGGEGGRENERMTSEWKRRGRRNRKWKLKKIE